MPKLTDFQNRTVLVCIPALTGPDAAAPFTLAAVEISGLWLESEEPIAPGHRVHPASPPTPLTTAFFAPFAAIAYVLDGTHILTPAQREVGAPLHEAMQRARARIDAGDDPERPERRPSHRKRKR